MLNHGNALWRIMSVMFYIVFRPAPRSSTIPLAANTEAADLEPENKGLSTEDYSEDSIKSGSSGFGSLPRKRTSLVTSGQLYSQQWSVMFPVIFHTW